MADQTLSITIYSAVGVAYKGKVKALTSINEKGKFDILPMHTNFISVIKDYLTIHEQGGKEIQLKLKTGVLKVINNQVAVFLGIEGLGK